MNPPWLARSEWWISPAGTPGPHRQRRELLIALLMVGATGGLWFHNEQGRRATGWQADLCTGVGGSANQRW